MANLLKIAGLLVALAFVKPLAWLERALSAGRSLSVMERILGGASLLACAWTAWLVVLYVPHFVELVEQMQLELPGVTRALLYGDGFCYAIVGVATTALVAMRGYLPARLNLALLSFTAFGGLLMAQLARVALALPFVSSGGCPHP